MGRKVLGEVANVAQPDTILAWYRKLVARTFDGSKAPRSPGRPRIKGEVEQLIVRMAKGRAQQRSEKSSVQQGDKSQEACIARREREGLNTRFAAHRCVNPYN